jgi:hypothetical protein
MASKHNLLETTDTSPLRAKSQKTQHSADLLGEDAPRDEPDTTVVANTESTFRFLDLPRELRYMVYERISFDTNRYELQDPEWLHGRFEMKDSDPMPEWIPDDTGDHPSLVLVTKSLSSAILASCRLINAEARGFLAPKLALLKHSERFHFNCHVDAIHILFAMFDDDTIGDGSSAYTLCDNTYTQADPEYTDIDLFVKKVSSIAWWGYPRTTSIAIRYTEEFNHEEQEDHLDDTRRQARDSRLSQFIPGTIRICNVRKMIEEGRESV